MTLLVNGDVALQLLSFKEKKYLLKACMAKRCNCYFLNFDCNYTKLPYIYFIPNEVYFTQPRHAQVITMRPSIATVYWNYLMRYGLGQMAPGSLYRSLYCY